MRLRGKIVCITDADSASGKTLIRRLADEGADFIVNSASAGVSIDEELAYCRVAGAQALVFSADLCRFTEVDGMLEEAERQLGRVDVLVHNHNLIVPMQVESCDEAAFVQVMNTNAKSAFLCTQAAGKRMAAAGSGSIVYVSSVHAHKPTGSSFAYSVSKSAVNMLAREAALELGRCGVNVNTIELGPVEGDDTLFSSEVSSLYESYIYKVPGAKPVTYRDLADCVAYLAADSSRYLNGAELRLDGGFLLHYMDHKMKRPEAGQ
ncbi:SDR family NAD(P)-dependent oxidoreductase [Paenibacillus thalictri]|uniref:SDR family oxidoreductase n=1 Tax=Paenibacillus thalictri TaxID=2527873 RepID=A0A4Q9DJN0_9BACL|nr:SDR family oxidoreductase [Paenibacillus thalictri]TBL71600.1 SDR family oxidoreductase [Paenibacillus thalictri]